MSLRSGRWWRDGLPSFVYVFWVIDARPWNPLFSVRHDLSSRPGTSLWHAKTGSLALCFLEGVQWIVRHRRNQMSGLFLSQVCRYLVQNLVDWFCVHPRPNAGLDHLVFWVIKLRLLSGPELCFSDETRVLPSYFEIECSELPFLDERETRLVRSTLGLGWASRWVHDFIWY